MWKSQPEFKCMFLDVKYFWPKEIIFFVYTQLILPHIPKSSKLCFYAQVALILTENTVTVNSKNQALTKHDEGKDLQKFWK